MDMMDVDVRHDESIEEAHSSNDDIHWRFLQVKGVMDNNEPPNDGLLTLCNVLYASVHLQAI